MPRNVPASNRMPAREKSPQEEVKCKFCPKPEKKTKWFHEDSTCLIINKPSGEPMVVLKRHTTEPTQDEMEHMKEKVTKLCGNHDFRVLLAHVPNHWHAHIENYDHHPANAE